MVKVSVIIPVYNTEKYLKECLDTVINQTLKEIEIILINNGSSDKSLSILKHYKSKDKRITIIDNKTNVTAGKARNQGLEIATGEYLSFLDSDDYFELNMLENIYEVCKKNDSDIGIFNSEIFDNITKEMVSQIKPPYFFGDRNSQKTFSPLTYKNMLFNIFGACAWNKIFKTEFIKKNDIKFQEIIASNDVAFVCEALALSRTISYLNEIFVHYRLNRLGNLSTSRKKKASFVYDALENTKYRLQRKDVLNVFSKSFSCFFVENLIEALIGTEEIEFERVKKALIKNNIAEANNNVVDRINCFFYTYITKLTYEEFLKTNFQKIYYSFYYSKLLKYMSNFNGNNIALWGIGKNGQAFVDVFSKEINITSIIDNALNKQGKYYNGIKIESFEEVKYNIDIIVVTNRNFYEDILLQINKVSNKIIVIDIDSYLHFEIDFIKGA